MSASYNSFNHVCFKELNEFESSNVRIFNNYHGVLEPSRLAKLNNNDIVIYSQLGESLNDTRLEQVLAKFSNQFVIVITTQKHFNFPLSSNKYQIITIPSAYAAYTTIMDRDTVQIDNRNFEKLFLSFNKRAQWTRQALAQFAVNTKLNDRMFLSYHCHDVHKIGTRQTYLNQNEIIGTTWFNQDLDLEYFYSLIPITINIPDEFHSRSVGNKDFYEKSFCSIVTETYIGENHDPFFTEKIFKPIAFAHPFIVSSSAGALSLLKNLGFKTYSDIFNEEYDEIENHQLRFEAILKEMLRLAALSDNEIQSMYKKVIPTIKYNYNFFYNELPKIYNNDIQRIKQQIQSIIDKI